MNLALHGFLLQVFVLILNLHHGRLLCSAGEPGYLDFDNLPETNFSCQGKVIGGYYADVEAGCQMFHVCTIGQKDEIMDIKFLCLNGTVFDQETRVCERVDEVDCSKSERFYNLNLELYGNNAVTLSLHENDNDDEDDLTDHLAEDHQPRTTSTRPSTTSTTPNPTTTSRSSKPSSTTVASGSFQHPAGYPQHYQPQPPFPQVHTSQSKSLYDDKNGGYHHQYIFHNGGERVNNQATSYQLFSSQGAVSSTTPSPQIHPQIRYSSTVGPPPQIIQHNEPSTVTPLYHSTSSATIQTLLNSNANSPTALINPIFHNHGIASTTEFAVHSNNPRETADYRDEDDHESMRLEAIQSTNKGKVSKLTISPVPSLQESSRTMQTKSSQTSQQQRISDNFLPTTPTTIETTIRSFYPTPRPSPKSSQSVIHQSVTQRGIHRTNSPGMTVPQLKPHQITINLPPPDIQRIVQNPSPLLPSQSRVIVTAKASVSDESGRSLNTTQLVTLPLPTIPASYDDYKEGDESFDPFYRDVPKIFQNRQQAARDAIEKIRLSRRKRSHGQLYHLINGADNQDEDFKTLQKSESQNENKNTTNVKNADAEIGDFRTIKKSLIKFRDILISDKANEDTFRNTADEIENTAERIAKDSEILKTKILQQTKEKEKVDILEDLKTDASKHLTLDKETDEKEEDKKSSHEDLFLNIEANAKKLLNKKKHIKNTSESESKLKFETNVEFTTTRSKKNISLKDDIDVIILDSDNDFKIKTTNSDIETSKTDASLEIIIEEESKSDLHDVSKTDEKVIHNEQLTGYLTKESKKQSDFITDKIIEKQLKVPQETIEQKNPKDFREEKSDLRRKISRGRSSRRRISSKIKQQKTNNAKLTETIQQKEEMDKTTATITNIITTTPSVFFEKKVAEQVDSHIFESQEPKSQTSREVEMTTIIDQRDETYLKSLENNKSSNDEKNKKIEQLFDHQIVENNVKDLERYTNKSEEAEQETEYTNLEDTNFTENPQSTTETESTKVTHVFEEKKFDEEFFSEYETLYDDESNTNTEDKKFKAYPEETPKISFHEATISHEKNLEQEELSYREDSSEKTSSDDLNEEEHSTLKYNEETNYEEYSDIELSVENLRDTNVQEDYKELKSIEENTTSNDYTNFEEYNDFQEDITDSTKDIEDSTEGILKFTDELPRSNDKDYNDAETKETLKSDKNDTHDYIDDNYEPENYKEEEIATKSNNSREEKIEENDEEKRDATSKDLETHQIDNEAKTQLEYTEESITKVADLEKVTNLVTTLLTTTTAPSTTASNTSITSSTTTSNTITSSTIASSTTALNTTMSSTTASSTLASSTSASSIIASSTTMSSTTASSTTMSSTTASSTTVPTTMSSSATATPTTMTTTTPRPTTTTTRSTSPKLFKPIGNRRIYAYVPPTTTPIPVVIKSRMSLFNPKPAKPPKSYNELAPKPVIRKLTLTRKPITTTVATTAIITTEKLKIESPTEIITEPITTESITTMMTTTTESGKSKENILESKLETNEPISIDSSVESDQTNKKNQLLNLTEQSSAVNRKNADPQMSTKEIETTTLLSSLTSLASPIEQTTIKVKTEPQERIDISTTTSLSLTTLPIEKSYVEYSELSTDTYPEEAETTTTFVKDHQHYVTVTPSVFSEYPTSVSTISTSTMSTSTISTSTISTSTTVQFKNVDSFATTKSTIYRPNNRKPAGSRKHASFNCLEKEMYRFYGDARDCRLFHYCSPGFTARQVLDFRFVCEEDTAFDEETQSCRHDVNNQKCWNRSW